VSLNPSHITIEAKIRWDGPNDFQQRIVEKSSFAELAQYGLSVLQDARVQVEIRTSSATTSVNVQSTGVVARGSLVRVELRDLGALRGGAPAAERPFGRATEGAGTREASSAAPSTQPPLAESGGL